MGPGLQGAEGQVEGASHQLSWPHQDSRAAVCLTTHTSICPSPALCVPGMILSQSTCLGPRGTLTFGSPSMPSREQA